MRECLVFKVADRELDDGSALAVLGLDDCQRLGAVGQEREVAPVRPELGLRPIRRVRRTISRLPLTVVSVICASPASGSP